MGVFTELKKRGLIAQMTNPEKIEELLDKGKVTFYIGFDPTADSLHVGHFLQMIIMSHMQKAGHRPIAIVGGGTGMVGDPSGRSDMRKMMTKEQVDHNVACFKKQMSRFIDFSEGRALIVDNGDWLLKLNYIEFLRDVGVHFSVNKMLSYECFKSRYERGLSFFEFNYMLMQSYDFLKLYRDYGCVMQMGGDDQWANILAGTDLVRRAESEEVYGITFKLLTTSEGKKMGKTQKGAVWLDPEKTSPYEFYQYWRNIEDSDVIRCLKMLTFLPLEEIEKMEKWEGSELNRAKEILAFELTKMVHGEEEANKSKSTARSLFGTGANIENMPSTNLSEDLFKEDKISIIDLLVACGIAPSNGEARRLIKQGGISLDGERINDIKKTIEKNAFKDGIVIKKGKKTFHKATI